MNTQRVITSAGDKTSHYTGVGYQYFFTNDAAHGRTCKMQVAKQMLGDFFKGVGAINSINLPHLEIMDQGNGWWLICADQPQNDTVVTRFIARFNRWALARANAKPAPTPAPDRARYTIEVAAQGLGRMKRPGQQRLSSAQPVVADEGSLKELADKVNERFGHRRNK